MAQEPLGQSAGGVQTAPDQYGRRKKIPNQIIIKRKKTALEEKANPDDIQLPPLQN
jgi:hypothetical protein